MENLSELVNQSLARNNFIPTLDHQRIQWSKWFRCESSFSVLLVPPKGGIFALAEEVIAPGETAATGGKRMLAVFQVTETEDLAIALGRLFLPANPLRQRLQAGNCFVRYTSLEDAAQRHSAHIALQQWMSSEAGLAVGT